MLRAVFPLSHVPTRVPEDFHKLTENRRTFVCPTIGRFAISQSRV